MQFRLTQRHIIAFNFLLIAGIAYFAARSVNDIIVQSLQGAPALPPPVLAGAAAQTAHPRDYYDQIVKRDVFNLVPQEVAAPVVTTVDLHIKLLGTSQATRERPFAIIEDQNGEQALYTVGDDIPGAGRLVSVQKNRILVLAGGQQVALDLPKDEMPTGVESVRSTPPRYGLRKPIQLNPSQRLPPSVSLEKKDKDENDVPDVDVDEEGDNRYGLKRNEIKDALAHSTKLFQQIHATPNIQNGKTNGFTLDEIEPGSVFEDLGLEDGDQLTAIDGRQIENPAEAVGLLSTIQTRSSVDITVMRDGHPVSLHYDIH
ncbi:MAG TPA: type II secretion system protein GspC [Candidatus Binataceae bacterium]|nr:type II secretion system protein GspC [Candidatus Binataceae bacterium]